MLRVDTFLQMFSHHRAVVTFPPAVLLYLHHHFHICRLNLTKKKQGRVSLWVRSTLYISDRMCVCLSVPKFLESYSLLFRKGFSSRFLKFLLEAQFLYNYMYVTDSLPHKRLAFSSISSKSIHKRSQQVFLLFPFMTVSWHIPVFIGGGGGLNFKGF